MNNRRRNVIRAINHLNTAKVGINPQLKEAMMYIRKFCFVRHKKSRSRTVPACYSRNR